MRFNYIHFINAAWNLVNLQRNSKHCRFRLAQDFEALQSFKHPTLDFRSFDILSVPQQLSNRSRHSNFRNWARVFIQKANKKSKEQHNKQISFSSSESSPRKVDSRLLSCNNKRNILESLRIRRNGLKEFFICFDVFCFSKVRGKKWEAEI